MRAQIVAALALLLSTMGSAHAQIRIGLMVSATGPTSAIGIPQRNTGDLLPRTIAGARVEYISLEDGGDATRAIQNVRKLIEEDRIDALIGPSTT
jgi:branched-chain amino acid transport system substrate-binding protein